MANPLTKLKARKIKAKEAADLIETLEQGIPKIAEAVSNALIINCMGGGAKQNVTVNLTIQVKL